MKRYTKQQQMNQKMEVAFTIKDSSLLVKEGEVILNTKEFIKNEIDDVGYRLTAKELLPLVTVILNIIFAITKYYG
jgi:hypothetical protein